MSHRAAKITVGVAVLAALVGLLALAAPLVTPVLPRQVQVALGGTVSTAPGNLDALLATAGLEENGQYGDTRVTHGDVDIEYVDAAAVWPWDLPPGWNFPRNRGVSDTPGSHWNGMGVKAAFSLWATASLDAVQGGGLTPDTSNRLLDMVEDAYTALYAKGVLTDARFVEDSVTPLRQ